MILMSNGHMVKVTAEPGVPLFDALKSSQFTDWLDSMDAETFTVKEVVFQSLDWFVEGVKIGFVKWKGDVREKKTGRKLPSVVFASGGAVAVLLILRCRNRKYVVMVVQARVPTGSLAFVEIVAGMLDGSGDFAGKIAQEIKEEVGITISKEDLIDLGSFATANNTVYTSPGRCDETLRFYCVEKDVEPDELNSFKGRLTGAIEEGEQITLKVMPLHELTTVPDAKTLAAYTLYRELEAKRKRAQRSQRRQRPAREVAA